MRKYRIIKKTNYKIRHKMYDVVYFIEVKSLFFYFNLKWWSGTDINDDDWSRHYDYCLLDGFPKPFHSTIAKFPDEKCEPLGDDIYFTNIEAAKFFIEQAKAQEEFMDNTDKMLKGKKSKEEIIYIEENNNNNIINL